MTKHINLCDNYLNALTSPHVIVASDQLTFERQIHTTHREENVLGNGHHSIDILKKQTQRT